MHAQYLYDGAGMRVKKLVRKQGGQYTVTVYVGGLFEYHRSVQGAAVQENNTLHVMDDQSRIALVRIGTPFPDDTTPAVKYHLGDHLGSSHVVIGGDGAWLNREEYSPYGETSFGSFARKRYRFTGKERDEESGLNYHAARHYAPWVARWVSCDPKGLIDGPNPYRYTRNNPVGSTDPSGTESKPNTEQSKSTVSGFPDATGVKWGATKTGGDNITGHSGGSHDECERTGCHKSREDLPAPHPFNRHPGSSPLVNPIPDGNAERVRGALSDLWNYPLAPISLPIRGMDAALSGLVDLAIDTGLGPAIDDPAHQELVQPLRTWAPVILGTIISGGELAMAKTLTVKPVVTAEARVNRWVFNDVNQTARVGANAEQPTLIAKRVAASSAKSGKVLPNGNMGTAHAEVGAMQQAFDAGVTTGADMILTVTGKAVCGYCRGDLAAMAKEAGLISLSVFEEATGLKLFWQPGMRSLKRVD